MTADVIAAGRKLRGLAADLMIAAITEDLTVCTTNPADFTGLDALIPVVPVTRPPVPHEQPAH